MESKTGQVDRGGPGGCRRSTPPDGGTLALLDSLIHLIHPSPELSDGVSDPTDFFTLAFEVIDLGHDSFHAGDLGVGIGYHVPRPIITRLDRAFGGLFQLSSARPKDDTVSEMVRLRESALTSEMRSWILLIRCSKWACNLWRLPGSRKILPWPP